MNHMNQPQRVQPVAYSRQGNRFKQNGGGNNGDSSKAQKIVVSVLYVINLIAVLAFVITLLLNNVLPTHIRIIYIVIIAAIEIGLGIAVFKSKHTEMAATVVLSIAFVLFTIGHAGATFYLNRTMHALDNITANEDMEFVQFSLVVQKGSPIRNLQDATTVPSLAAGTQDKERTEAFLTALLKDEKVSLQVENCQNYPMGAKTIMEDNSKVLILNEAYRGPLDEVIEGFSDKTEVIFTKGIYVPRQPYEDLQKEENRTPMSEDSFNIYISGIDTFGKLTTVSRSDVNLIMSVNPKTKKILITSIPRDAYVPIAGGGHNQKDKLTHAGIYGIESSKATLENLFNIKIDYYARVNFTSLVDMVDVLGGIQVDNPVAFTSKISNHSYDKGKITLNGDEALYFARERKHLAGGDFDRGKNHQRIIEGMVNKMLSPAILTNYTQILNVLMESTQSNFPKDVIIKIINEQIADPSAWTFETANVTGVGARGLPSYAMPGYNLYMMKVDEKSVQAAHQMMDEVLNETPTGQGAPDLSNVDTATQADIDKAQKEAAQGQQAQGQQQGQPAQPAGN